MHDLPDDYGNQTTWWSRPPRDLPARRQAPGAGSRSTWSIARAVAQGVRPRLQERSDAEDEGAAAGLARELARVCPASMDRRGGHLGPFGRRAPRARRVAWVGTGQALAQRLTANVSAPDHASRLASCRRSSSVAERLVERWSSTLASALCPQHFEAEGRIIGAVRESSSSLESTLTREELQPPTSTAQIRPEAARASPHRHLSATNASARQPTAGGLPRLPAGSSPTTSSPRAHRSPWSVSRLSRVQHRLAGLHRAPRVRESRRG